MDVVVDKEKERSIDLGDIFVSSKGYAFILIESPFGTDGCATVNMRGYSSWNTYSDFSSAVRQLEKDVECGILKHYSFEEWHLRLEKK